MRYGTSIAVLMLALAISGSVFVVSISTLDRYMEDRGFSRIKDVFGFYDSAPDNSILILGSSNAMDGIDAYALEEKLGYPVFNLGLSGDDALRRLTELDHIESIRPKAVIIVTSHYFFSDNYHIHDDQYALVSNSINIPKDDPRYRFFDEHTHELIRMKYFGRLFYQRKYLVELIFDMVSAPIGRDVNMDFLWEDTEKAMNNRNLKNLTLFDETIDPDSLKAGLKDSMFLAWMNNYSAEENLKKEAFEYMMDELDRAGIRTIAVNMPVNPVLKEYLEKDDEYREYISGWELLDYEDIYDYTAFKDSTHLRVWSKNDFSERLAGDLEGMI